MLDRSLNVIVARLVPGGLLDVPDGWWPLVVELHAKLTNAAPGYMFRRLAQTGGALDVEVELPADLRKEMRSVVDKAVSDAKGKALAICPDCGTGRAPGIHDERCQVR